MLHEFFFDFLWLGEITVASMMEFDPGAHLCERDVALNSLMDPSVVKTRIEVSKTDPFHLGITVYTGKTGNAL